MNAFEAVVFTGVVMGSFLLVGLVVRNRTRGTQNHYFYSLLTLITMGLLSKWLFTIDRYLLLPHLWFFIDIFAYGIGPLWYLSLLSSFDSSKRLATKDWLLLSPILYYVGLNIYFWTLSRNQLLATTRLDGFEWTVYVFFITTLFVNGVFLWRAHQRMKQQINLPVPLRLASPALLGVFIVWLASFIWGLYYSYSDTFHFQVYQYAFVASALLTLTVAFVAFIQPTSFQLLTDTFNVSEYSTLKEIARRVRDYLEAEETFLTPNYSLRELAAAIGVNAVITSKAINRILDTNFNDLLNEYRVQHFLKLVQGDRSQQLTIWAIAQEAGFGNKATFYKSFRKYTGTTPKAYLVAVAH